MGERRSAYTVLEGPAVDGREILKGIFKMWVRDVDWINLAQKRDSWWDLVNAVVNF